MVEVTVRDFAKLCPAVSHPFTISVCVPAVSPSVVSRFGEDTVYARDESTYTCMDVTGKPENPLATTWTCKGTLAPLAGLLTITSGALTVTVVLAEEDAPALSVTFAVSV